MKLGRLNHVGVATPSIEQSVKLYREKMGAQPAGDPFDLPAQGVRVCFVDAPNMQVELIEPLGATRPSRSFSRRTRRAVSIICASRLPTLTRRGRGMKAGTSGSSAQPASGRTEHRFSSCTPKIWAAC